MGEEGEGEGEGGERVTEPDLGYYIRQGRHVGIT